MSTTSQYQINLRKRKERIFIYLILLWESQDINYCIPSRDELCYLLLINVCVCVSMYVLSTFVSTFVSLKINIDSSNLDPALRLSLMFPKWTGTITHLSTGRVKFEPHINHVTTETSLNVTSWVGGSWRGWGH